MATTGAGKLPLVVGLILIACLAFGQKTQVPKEPTGWPYQEPTWVSVEPRDLRIDLITLNSDGGILLLGVQTNSIDPRTETLKPLSQWDDQRTFEKAEIHLTQSQILDRVNSNLSPQPFGVEVNAIDVPITDGMTTVFVVSVPTSMTAAHQSTRSLRYYKRIADSDQPMLDYEIRDVNNRRAGPLLILETHLSNLDGTHIQYLPDGEGSLSTLTEKGRFNLVLTTRNIGRATATIAKFDIGLPYGWVTVGQSDWFRVSPLEQQMYESVVVFLSPGISRLVPRTIRAKKIDEQQTTWYRRRWPISDIQDYPLWPSSETLVPLGTIEIQAPNKSEYNVWLPWRIMAEGMPDIRGVAFLKQETSGLKVINFDLNANDWAVDSAEEQRFNTLLERYGIR